MCGEKVPPGQMLHSVFCAASIKKLGRQQAELSKCCPCGDFFKSLTWVASKELGQVI